MRDLVYWLYCTPIQILTCFLLFWSYAMERGLSHCSKQWYAIVFGANDATAVFALGQRK